MDSKNDITELRNVLFDTIRGLKDKTIDPDQAKAINETAQVIINSAKVEVDHARITGKALSSGFIPEKDSGNRAGGYLHRIGDRGN